MRYLILLFGVVAAAAGSARPYDQVTPGETDGAPTAAAGPLFGAQVLTVVLGQDAFIQAGFDDPDGALDTASYFGAFSPANIAAVLRLELRSTGQPKPTQFLNPSGLVQEQAAPYSTLVLPGAGEEPRATIDAAGALATEISYDSDDLGPEPVSVALFTGLAGLSLVYLKQRLKHRKRRVRKAYYAMS